MYKLLYDGLYDELIKQSLPVLESDKDAERAFLRLFLSKNATFLIGAPAVELLRQAAEKGNRYAQYGLARWQSMVRPNDDALAQSFQNFQAAAEQKLPDAIAGLALAYEYGDMGSVDWEKAEELLDKAMSLGSELAYVYKLKEFCFGVHYKDAQPDKAVDLANQLIATYKANEIEPNGYWYYFRATAKEGRVGRTRVTDDYEEALKLGVLEAYTDLIMASGYGDENGVLIESKEYTRYVQEGIANRCAGAFYLDAARELSRYSVMEEEYTEREIMTEKIPADRLQKSHDFINTRLHTAAQLGDNAAIEQLGDMYAAGSYGYPQSFKQAAEYYAQGVKHDSAACAEKLWKLIHNHDIDRPLDEVDYLVLCGARWGSKRLLAEAVIAHQEGRLEDYADEVEKYYDPIFDSPEFSLDNDEDWMGVIDGLLGDDDDDDFDDDLLNDDDDPDSDDYPDDDGRYDAWA